MKLRHTAIITLICLSFTYNINTGKKNYQATNDSDTYYFDKKTKKKKLPKKTDSLEYLQAEAFQKRHQQALEWLNAYPQITHVVEIGGGLSPLGELVTNKKVIVIDRVVPQKSTPHIEYIRKYFQDWDGSDAIKNTCYAVVILGLALDMQDDGWNKLFSFIHNAHIAIIERSATYGAAKQQLKLIKKNANKKIIKRADFDLSSDMDDYKKPCPTLRTMVLLENNEPTM